MTHPRLDIDLLTEAGAAAAPAVQPDVPPVGTDVVEAARAGGAFPTDDPWVDHDGGAELEGPVGGVAGRQSGDAAAELVAEGDGEVVACYAVGLRGRVDRVGAGGVFVEVGPCSPESVENYVRD